MDLRTLIEKANGEGVFVPSIRDARLQFGLPGRRYLGYQFLPEQLSDENSIREDLIRYEVVIADDGNPYSPPQIKAVAKHADLRFELGHIDIAAQMTPKDLKTLGRLLNDNDESAALAFVSRWLQRSLALGVIEKGEKQIWEALANAQVTIQNKNNDTQVVQLKNPTNHRFTVPSGTEAALTGFYSPTYDPIVEAFLPMKQTLADAGLMIRAIITSTRIAGVLSSNQKMIDRGNGPNSATLAIANTNQLLIANGFPALTTYDLRYRTQLSTAPFLDPSKIVFVCETARDQDLDLGDEGIQVVPNTLGYYGVGISVGQSEPGRVVTTEFRQKKPVGVYAECYQEGFPVVLEPDAIGCITVPEPTP